MAQAPVARSLHQAHQMHEAQQLQRLAKVGWLSEQPEAFQARIAAAGRWASYRRGAVVYAEAQEGTAIYGLGEGWLDVAIGIGPAEKVVIHRAAPGFWIGDSAVLAGATRAVEVRAAADSKVFRVPAAAVHRILKEHPGDWACFYRLSHRNTTLALRVVAELLALRPKARLARLLLRLASPDGEVRATQDELGHLAAMSRASFRRASDALVESGVLVTAYGGLYIADMAALEAVAREG